MVERYAVPLTFVFVRDEDAWVALACEIDVASDGRSLDEARYMIEDAVGLWVTVEIEEGRGDRLARPVPPEELARLLNVPPEDRAVEYRTLLLVVESEPKPKVDSLEFLPSAVAPACCQLPVAA